MAKIRCNHPECRNVVNMMDGFIRHDNRIFCSTSCVNAYILQVQRFALTTQIVRQDPPLNYTPRKRII